MQIWLNSSISLFSFSASIAPNLAEFLNSFLLEKIACLYDCPSFLTLGTLETNQYIVLVLDLVFRVHQIILAAGLVINLL